MTSLSMHAIIANGNPGIPGQTVRMITFIDKEMDGVAPVVGDLLDTSTALPVIAPMNADNLNRFHILQDQTMTLCPGSTTDVRAINRYWKLNRKAHFGTLGTGADADSFEGQPFTLICCDVGASLPNWGYSTRLNFFD